MNDVIREFIRSCGGPAKVARLTGTKISTVSSWSARRSIPIEHWQAFVDAGVDINRLWEIHQNGRKECEKVA